MTEQELEYSRGWLAAQAWAWMGLPVERKDDETAWARGWNAYVAKLGAEAPHA